MGTRKEQSIFPFGEKICRHMDRGHYYTQDVYTQKNGVIEYFYCSIKGCSGEVYVKRL